MVTLTRNVQIKTLFSIDFSNSYHINNSSKNSCQTTNWLHKECWEIVIFKSASEKRSVSFNFEVTSGNLRRKI